jgi:hypothetical protein
MLGIAFLLWLVLIAPRLVVPALSADALRGVSEPARRLEIQNERMRLQNDVRTTFLQGLGGAVIVLGAYITARQLKVSREQLQHNVEASREQHELDSQGQITERFARAIDQLGSDKVDVRVGAIYTLERVARDSRADRTAVSEVLATYVRVHASRRTSRSSERRRELSGRDPEQVRAMWAEVADLPKLWDRAADVQAAVTVLGRPTLSGETDGLVLARVDLRRADLRGLGLSEADLFGADFQVAWMDATNLEGAVLRLADLQWAGLWGARLRGADLRGADLHGALLGGADLSDAVLDGADLSGVKADPSTKWPEGFDWQAAGVVMNEDSSVSREKIDRVTAKAGH